MPGADLTGTRYLPLAGARLEGLRSSVKREVLSSNPGALPRRELLDLHDPELQASTPIEETRKNSEHEHTSGHWRSSAPNQTGQGSVAIE